MRPFPKAQLASLCATAVDFGVTAWAGGLLQGEYVAAAALGTVGGGVVHFCLGRNWVFGARDGKVAGQAVRYAATWAGNLGLNALGVYALTHGLAIHYLVSKMVISLLLAGSYNYLLHSHFVFRKP